MTGTVTDRGISGIVMQYKRSMIAYGRGYKITENTFINRGDNLKLSKLSQSSLVHICRFSNMSLKTWRVCIHSWLGSSFLEKKQLSSSLSVLQGDTITANPSALSPWQMQVGAAWEPQGPASAALLLVSHAKVCSGQSQPQGVGVRVRGVSNSRALFP